MLLFTKKFDHPGSPHGWLPAVTDLAAAIQWLAFVASLWSLLLHAFSPNPKIFIVMNPLSSPSLSFTRPPTPPSEAAKAVEPNREEVEPQPRPPSAALFVCFVVAHTIARHVPDVLGTQRKPTVSSGRGIEESLDIIPIPDPPSDKEGLRNPAVYSRRGTEESSDVTTTPIRESTSIEDNVDINGKANNEPDHDDPPIHSNTAENTGTNVISIQKVKDTLGLAIVYALAAAKKTNSNRVHALARRIQWHHTQRVTPESTTRKSTDPFTVDTTRSPQIEAIAEGIEEVEKVESEYEGDNGAKVKEAEKEDLEVNDQDIKDNMNESEELDVEVAEVGATVGNTKDIQVTTATKSTKESSQDTNEDDDDSGEWFTICKGKVVKTSALSMSRSSLLVSAAASTTSEETDTVTSSSTFAGSPAPGSTESVAEVSTSKPQSAVTEKWSQEEEWRAVRRVEKLPAFPPEPQAPPPSHRYRIVPANNPNWGEEKAERHRREMEAWNAFKEAERAAERAKVEEEERKAREAEEAKAARIAKFSTTMSRLEELLKAAKEAREKEEKEKEENQKAIRKIDSTQNRIGEIIDIERARTMFDPKVLKTSSFSSVVGQGTAIPEPEVPQASSSSSVAHTSNAAAASSSVLQQNAADHLGPPRVLPSNWGVRYGTVRKSKTIERRLRRRRNELKRLNGEAGPSSSGSGGEGESPQQDGA